MRIATGGISHESNTFSTVPTTWESFAANNGLSEGEEIFERFADTNTVTCGFMEGCSEYGYELAPLIWTAATPSDAVQQKAYERLKSLFLERLEGLGKIDGALLDLHGAMVAKETEDVEGDLLEAVRGVVGPEVPVVATLDLHTNMTTRMVRNTDVLVGFDTYPHVDMYERGREAAAILRSILEQGIRPTMAFHKLSLFWAVSKQVTHKLPMKDVMDYAHRIEEEPGIVNVTVSTGFPYADIAEAGASVTVTTDDDPGLAQSKADELAEYIFDRRKDWQDTFPSVREAIRMGQQEGAYPVVLADVADSPGGGDTCDGTEILRVFLEDDVPEAVVVVIADPESVSQAIRAGVGSEVRLRVGGKTDDLHGEPVSVVGYVALISDGRFVLKGPMRRGTVAEMGRTVVVKSKGTEIIITERRVSETFDTQLLRSLGIEPADRKFIAVKSGVHFRSTYEPLAGVIYEVDTPGTNTCNFAKLPYKRIKRPLYPVDEM
jgi:microcystin degradation protein MlrC